METHTQCRLRRCQTETTSWIPTRYANVGAYVKLKGSDGWTDGWVVLKTGGTQPTEAITPRSRDHLSHRKATDV